MPLLVLRLIRTDMTSWPRHALAEWFTLAPCSYNLQLVRSGVGLQLSSWHGAAVSTRCHSVCCWGTVTSRRRLRSASSSALVVPATRRSSLGDDLCSCWTTRMEQFTSVRHSHSPLTFKKYLKTYLVYLFRAPIGCIKRPCVGRLRRRNFVKLHYISRHENTGPILTRKPIGGAHRICMMGQ